MAKYGTFYGVFLPTFLSIVGVILYLRLGYIVGSIGILGGLAVILLAGSITIATALSLSSITTNIRIGTGGAYSIISKIFGLEVGGSVGIPLYLAQLFSVALYIFGFSETARYFLPDTPIWLIGLVAFIVLMLLNMISTKIALRAQLVVFVLVIVSLVSIFAGGNFQSAGPVRIINPSFWVMFALFFPAVTGIMAGIGLSGELKDARKEIPKGVLSAWAITTVIYIAIAFWLWMNASPGALVSDSLILVKISKYGILVLAGILAATFSSALATFVAAPRLLQALAQNSIVPKSKFFAKRGGGEPRNAMLFTSIVIVFLLFVGSLNAVAPVLTMFFLIAYAVINIVVFVEQSLELPSFRPTLKIPRFVSLYGAIGSVLVMFLINAGVGIGALIFLFVIYLLLINKKLKQKEGDIRSGLLRGLAAWASKKIEQLPESTRHVWKPNILVPVVKSKTLLMNFPMIYSLAFPQGTMTVLGFDLTQSPEGRVTKKQRKREERQLKKLVKDFSERSIFTSFSKVTAKQYPNAIRISLEAMESQVFHPNLLFLPFKPTLLPLKNIFNTAKKENTGLVIFDIEEGRGLGNQKEIHLWLRGRATSKNYEKRNFDLAMLISYILYRNWDGRINIWTCCDKNKKKVEKDINKLIYESRFPLNTKVNVVTNDFFTAVKVAPDNDIHIIPFSKVSDLNIIERVSKIDKTFLFVMDSGKEDVLS